jgi:hypothetical protein
MIRKFYLATVLSVAITATSCKKENQTEASNEAVVENNASATGSKQLQSDVNNKPTFEAPTDGKYPVITFKHAEYDFGDIKQGEVVEHTFEFTNTGEADLIIGDAKASCGCTVPEYPKNKLIKPGEKGTIKVSFDSDKKRGSSSKTVTLITNTQKGTELLTIKTNIITPENK